MSIYRYESEWFEFRIVGIVGGAGAFGLLQLWVFYHGVGVFYQDAFYVALMVSLVLSVLAMILWPLILRERLQLWVAIFHVIAGPSVILTSVVLGLFSGYNPVLILCGIWGGGYGLWMTMDGLADIRAHRRAYIIDGQTDSPDSNDSNDSSDDSPV